MSTAFVFIALALALFNFVNGDENITVTEANTPQYIFTPNVSTTWIVTFTPNLRGFIIFDKYFVLKDGEQITIYNGNKTEPRYCLANYTSNSNSTVANQRLTFGKGQGFKVIYSTNSGPTSSTSTSTTTTTTTTTPSTTSTTTTTTAPTMPPTTRAPEFFMFLVSAYDEPASLMNNTQYSGTFPVNVTDQSVPQSIETNSGVSQYWHFYPVLGYTRLSFLLTGSSAINYPNNNLTLVLYRGNADNLNDTSTIIKTYKVPADYDTESHIFDFGETLSLFFDYPFNNVSDIKIGYSFIVSPTVNGTITTTTPVTDASGNPINSTNPTVAGTSTMSTTLNTTGTSTVTETTTTSGAAPFIFSISPIIISLIFQKCQSH
uniref:Uncharacterized protein n=1 Tax=Panagrolaimus davidi TaxID=227884 RepID=A0A914P6I1_9BILA